MQFHKFVITNLYSPPLHRQSNANIHSQQSDAPRGSVGSDDMQYGLQLQEVSEMEAANEFCGPFVDIYHTGVVSEQTQLSAFESVFPAKAAEVFT